MAKVDDPGVFHQPLPRGLEQLRDLALDMRWTWSHGADRLWAQLDPVAWERTANPWALLQDVSREQLERAAQDATFIRELKRVALLREEHLRERSWYGRTHGDAGLRHVAYFCMEFGLGEALPLYAGGLGILAGDYLKTASDLGLPVVGVGLLYDQGYFRQIIDPDGRQREAYPYNDPISLPIQPVFSAAGGWLHVSVELPGRTLLLRVWKALVGRVTLYLLDSNDPFNSPVDRGITGELYGGNHEMRLLQEIVLGIGGWRALEAMGLQVDLCHLNEGHAAFVVLERARRRMLDEGVPFWEAWWATRAGNVFTTHTAVAAAFDAFDPTLIVRYLPYLHAPDCDLCISPRELLGLGRADPADEREPFNMTYLALRGSLFTNAVSELHGAVSRRLFRSAFPRWPEAEVPIGHITNGVHMPSWDSREADRLWEHAAGKARWRGDLAGLESAMREVSDAELWNMRAAARRDLVEYARRRLARQLGARGASPETIAQAARVLDPNALTLGFARRFTDYKRPNLLLTDPDRLARLLTDPHHPAQLVVAGKAHPEDARGKAMVKQWIDLVRDPMLRTHVVFLEDYDISLAQELLRGVDVWINTPRRPWEACGTSGMKVLVNGGLNLSELDGWWAEAYDPDVGWKLGDGREHSESGWDAREAEELYGVLERDVMPAFYDRNPEGVPPAWVARIRASMAQLTPQFSTNRMAREYVSTLYHPGLERLRERTAGDGELAHELVAWHEGIERSWHSIRFGNVVFNDEGDQRHCTAQVYLGDADPAAIRVELYADPGDEGEPAFRTVMTQGAGIPGATGGWHYETAVPSDRAAGDFTARVVPYHPAARVPLESQWILWQR
jgi:starch phosphorylase